jgi:2-polyprenyl-3-methyl-5-hydroxy-6-metoxy-1,4-benzoquinol methylase
MNVDKRDFDKEAASWDEHPVRVKLAADIASAISQQITLKPDMNVLDFGCGTGLLTLHVAPMVRSITGVDSSRGMLNVLMEKATKQRQNNVRVLQLDPDRGDTVTGQYDLIVSNMTFHHVENVESLLGQLHRAIRFSGYLCVADLDPDQGEFHEDNSGVFHFGFERTTLRRSLMQTGFAGIKDMTAAEVVKPRRNGEIQRFTVFLMVGQKAKSD